jgi:hypothetical protein
MKLIEEIVENLKEFNTDFEGVIADMKEGIAIEIAPYPMTTNDMELLNKICDVVINGTALICSSIIVIGTAVNRKPQEEEKKEVNDKQE